MPPDTDGPGVSPNPPALAAPDPLTDHAGIDADVAALVDEPWLETLQDAIDAYSDERTTEVCAHEGGRMQADCWRHQLARMLAITRRAMWLAPDREARNAT